MNRKEITTKEDLYKVIELLEKTGITYRLCADKVVCKRVYEVKRVLLN